MGKQSNQNLFQIFKLNQATFWLHLFVAVNWEIIILISGSKSTF